MARLHFSRRQLCIPYGLFLALFATPWRTSSRAAGCAVATCC